MLMWKEDLAKVNPELAKEWHPTKNGDLLPIMVTAGSKKKVWWRGKCGHEWQAVIVNRANGTNCPYCSGKKILLGYNDLLTTNPEIASEWNNEKNGTLLPSSVSRCSGKKVWWKCSLNHEWQASISNRVKGRNCPFCANKRVQEGYNDLASTNPDLAHEWHPTKNGDLLPIMVTAGSRKKVWWMCRKGHEWEAIIYSRSLQRTGCPKCREEQQTSFPEQAILFYCNKVTHADSRNLDYGREIDIFLPAYQVGIEYNGIYWHRNKNGVDKRKREFLADKNIRMITIAEGKRNIVFGDTIEYIYDASNRSSLDWAIQKLFQLLNFPKTVINVTNDAPMIYDQYITSEKENSLAARYPDIANQWNVEKNKALKPEMVMPNSNKKIWWKCQQGHEWQATVSSRTAGGNGCPCCAGQKVVVGYNDLATTNPGLSSEWCQAENGDRKPTDFSAGSREKVWWTCATCKKIYQAAIYHRTKGKSCPYCAGKIVVPGFNDLESYSPHLVVEWNLEKNGDLLPSHVSRCSGKKVWWKCSLNHEWQASISNRVKGRNCPFCANKRVQEGYNDLASTNPDLAIEWHPTKNGVLFPTMVTSGSHKKVWWLCKNGHEWQAKIENRSNGSNCPICAKSNNNHGK